MTRIRAGDGEALAALYREHHARVYRFLRTRLGDPDTAEDLASEVFLRALSSIDRYTWTGRDIAAWLMTIARNLLTDHLRSSSFRREVSTADPGEGGDGGSRVVRAAEELVLRELDRREVRAAVARLPEEYRKVIVLQMWGGMTMRQITTTLGRESIGATRVLRFRAMKRLRAHAGALAGEAGRGTAGV
ncbi:RNA polymerase sigma factor [Streptomyces sp. YIM 98790]|uniref:RNA polymerase sigma factor n=1 Tax=Streptomyces sp. YIM 98790 TaxID=2689077 RepID=UPI00140A0481|nr:sigma-70 family RNA polymerase sigma factor [Streptomyces sp. YIM 98790]